MFLMEFFLLALHASPFLKEMVISQMIPEIHKSVVNYSHHDLIGILKIITLLHQSNELFKSTKYNSPRIQRINLVLNNRPLNSSLPIKNYISNHPLKFMFISFFASIFFFSSILIIVERPISLFEDDKLLDEWTEMFWFVIVSMTTIGYGDRTVKNIVSRFIIMVLVIWGNFWSSIFLSAVFPYIDLSLREKKAFNQIKRLELKDEIRRLSSDVVKNIIKLNKISLDNEKNSHSSIKAINDESFELIKKLRQLKIDLNILVYDTSFFVDDVLIKIQKVVKQSELQMSKGNTIVKDLASKIDQIYTKARATDKKGNSKTSDSTIGALLHIKSILQKEEEKKESKIERNINEYRKSHIIPKFFKIMAETRRAKSETSSSEDEGPIFVSNYELGTKRGEWVNSREESMPSQDRVF
jgi:hypothetical protein